MKHRPSLFRAVYFAFIFIAAIITVSDAEDCPPCYFNQARPNTSGFAADGRPIVNVKIDSSWNVNNSGNAQAGTNANIWNGLAGCTGCVPPDGAAGMWNNAQGTGGFGINFNIQRNQNAQNPTIIIVRDDTLTDCANITSTPPGGPYTMRLPTSVASQNIWTIVGLIAHEIGHALGLANVTNIALCGQSSVMSPASSGCDMSHASVSERDVNQSRKSMDSATQVTCELARPQTTLTTPPGPTPTPTPPPSCAEYLEICLEPTDCCSGMTCGGNRCTGQYCPDQQYECMDPNEYWDVYQCRCVGPTPILVDVEGNGFSLTNAQAGVNFDLNSDGVAESLSWTSAGSDDAWLALDRNGNGVIDNGRELFGNFTVQPLSPEPNGFLALGKYDQVAQGGNNDGLINGKDGVFSRLLLWQDLDHNGISEPTELHTLQALGLKTVHLDYQESKKTDEHGNRFRYRAKVRDTRDAQLGRWAWDVFLVAP